MTSFRLNLSNGAGLMRLILLTACLLVSPSLALAADTDAKALAQGILDKGSALFDKRDPAAMAATYVEGAVITLLTRTKNESGISTKVTQGKSEILDGYQNVFKDRKESAKSRNVVEHAVLIAPDVLLIQGVFQVDTNEELKVPFTQLRTKSGDEWLIVRLDLYFVES